MERAFFIGRFQPFHLGHLQAIQQIEQDQDIGELMIGIGSSQTSTNFNNPFNVEERRSMIIPVLEKLHKPYQLIDIPDINNFPKWVEHVESITPKFGIVYTGNQLEVAKLFSEKEYPIRELKRYGDLSSTKVRLMMVEGKNWQDLVPDPVKEVIEQIKGVERVLRIYCRYPRPVVTADLIIALNEGFLTIIRGKEPFMGLPAWPGGHLNVGFEDTKKAAIREAEEETGLTFKETDVHLFDIYSNPGRDPRGHYVSAVYYTFNAYGDPKAMDDAAEIKILPYNKLPALMAFDHRKIADDFLSFLSNQNPG